MFCDNRVEGPIRNISNVGETREDLLHLATGGSLKEGALSTAVAEVTEGPRDDCSGSPRDQRGPLGSLVLLLVGHVAVLKRGIGGPVGSSGGPVARWDHLCGGDTKLAFQHGVVVADEGHSGLRVEGLPNIAAEHGFARHNLYGIFSEFTESSAYDTFNKPLCSDAPTLFEREPTNGQTTRKWGEGRGGYHVDKHGGDRLGGLMPEIGVHIESLP